MTHMYLSPDITGAPPLPAEFYERSANMRLYSALQHHDCCWPASVFGDEIDTLLARQHAEPYANGYRLTEAGVTHWEAYVRKWETGTPLSPGRKGAQPGSTRLLLAMRDGAWHDMTFLSQGYSRSHTFDICDRLHEQGYANKRRRESDRAWEFQITEAGRMKARELEGESEKAS